MNVLNVFSITVVALFALFIRADINITVPTNPSRFAGTDLASVVFWVAIDIQLIVFVVLMQLHHVIPKKLTPCSL